MSRLVYVVGPSREREIGNAAQLAPHSRGFLYVGPGKQGGGFWRAPATCCNMPAVSEIVEGA